MSTLNTSTSVVIADDSAPLRDRLREIVESIARLHLVAEAVNGNDTLTLVKKHEPMILLLDINMPGLNGIQVLKALAESLTDLIIVVLTNHAEEVYVNTCFKLGASYFLDKTKDINRLKPILENITQESISRQSSDL